MYDTTEVNALRGVWNTIKTSEHRENLVETLAKQLASGVENGGTVCSSGKIARIVSTLDGTSNIITSRPMWVVREEIASLAAKIREEYASREDEDEDVAVRHFEQRVKDEYVEKLGMNPALIEQIVQEYAAGF